MKYKLSNSVSVEESPYIHISRDLRTNDGTRTNEQVYAEMKFAKHLADKKAERASLSARGLLRKGGDSGRVPQPWEYLGKARSRGNILECGNFLEVWISAENFHTGVGVDGKKLAAQNKRVEDEKAIARRVNARAAKQIRRIVNTNNFKAMHTLTLAPPSKKNNKKYSTIPYDEQKDYDLVRRLFKVFMQRLLRELNMKSIPYLVVFELHDSVKTNPLKRGCWHLHLTTEVSNKISVAIRKTWTHGRVDSQDFRFDKKGNRRDSDICNPGAYIAEYIGKEGAQFGKKELRNKKRYTASRSVQRPKKRSLENCHFGGDFNVITYRGERYRAIYYKANTIPGSTLCSHTMHYIKEKNV